MNLDHLAQLATEATPGPWEWTDDIGVNWRRDQIMKQALQTVPTDLQRRIVRERGKDAGYTTTGHPLLFTGESPLSAADAAFIAAANPSVVLALVEVCRAAQELRIVEERAATDDISAKSRRDVDDVWRRFKTKLDDLEGL